MDEDEGEQEEDEEEVVVDRDYYYDGYKDYNGEHPTEPSDEKSLSEKEIMDDVKGNQPHLRTAVHLLKEGPMPSLTHRLPL